MLQIPRPSAQLSVSPYAKLGLKDLPFPTTPVVDPYNTDPRRNGAIYAEETVRPSLEKFQRLLIRPTIFRIGCGWPISGQKETWNKAGA